MRANPKNETISLLSFPRDLRAEIVCPGKADVHDEDQRRLRVLRLAGDAGDGSQADRSPDQLPDHRQLPRLHPGRRQARRHLDGRRPPLPQHHSGPTGYATINLQPGYQLLNGYQALDFVRFRHTDSDLYRNARQQNFVRALKDRGPLELLARRKLPKVIKALTSNIEVAQGGGKNVSAKTVLSYAVLAYSLPPGHVFQSRIEGLEGFSDLTTSSENISAAVRQWANPDVDSPKKATAVALGEKVEGEGAARRRRRR